MRHIRKAGAVTPASLVKLPFFAQGKLDKGGRRSAPRTGTRPPPPPTRPLGVDLLLYREQSVVTQGNNRLLAYCFFQ
jgi:hypothetical protein